jgi:uncharacterized protein YcfJ
MSKTTRAGQAAGAAGTAYEAAKANPYVQRIVEDEDLRDLRKATESLREASDQLRKPKRRKRRLGRLLILGAVVGGVALAVSEDARKAVMDTLFGAEEEFEYTSTTSGGNGSGT